MEQTVANAIPVNQKSDKKHEKQDVEIVGKLPEGFEIPAKAVKVTVDERGTVRVDLGF